MEPPVQLVHDFYGARARRDWDAVAGLLAPDVVWREAGDEDYSGAHRGREAVVELLQKLVEITDGTFRLEPREILGTAEHAAAAVRWQAQRGETHVAGYDLAVRIAAGQIAEAWFFPDGYDGEALRAVFSFGARG